MRFSVITVAFNNLAGLRATQASIEWSRPALFEWIVIDGASTDGTAQYLATLHAPNVRYVSERDGGIYEAMNKGLALASGEYCIFMNGGDLFAGPDVLADIDRLIGDSAPVLIYGDSVEYAGQARWQKPARDPRWNFYSMFTHHQSIFYRRQAIAGGYDTASYRFGGDWALTARVLRHWPRRVLRYPGTVCCFERDGITQRDDRRATINAEHWRILRREIGLSPPVALFVWYLKRSTNGFRRLFPRVYNLLRFREVGKRC
jgi:putative colanic acid biosynthesis glycosyltransferase